jgi:predicted ABC-type ATPase
VFSHPSKLELVEAAHAAGYVVALHVVMVPEDLAVLRVQYRVRAGGHHVPEGKIRERYQRLWDIVAAAIARSDLTTVYDNSGDRGPRIVVQLASGLIVGRPAWPDWAPPALATQRPAGGASRQRFR